MTPSVIQLVHALDNHKHAVCISIDEKHIHEKEIDCSLMHTQVQTLSIASSSSIDVIPQHFYATKFEFNNEFTFTNSIKKENPRGPPFFIV